jgi:hypothetical protein
MRNKMKKRILFYIVLLATMILLNNTSFAQSSKRIVKDQKSSGKSAVRLFNGKNLDGWYTFIKGKGKNIDPQKVFTVKDGKIRISGEEFGCITTDQEFDNYKLIVEFKWGDLTFSPRVGKARDSGVLLHSTGEDGGYSGIWMHSIECQVIEGGTGDLLVVGDGSKKFSLTCPVAPEKQESSYVFQPAGNPATIYEGRINWWGRDPGWKDVTGFRGAKDVEKPLGKWNRIECIAKGNEITIYLNGILVNQAIDVQPRKGHIQIQSEGAEIYFRRIELSSL